MTLNKNPMKVHKNIRYMKRTCFERKPSTGQLHVDLNGSGPREVPGKTKNQKNIFFREWERSLKKMAFLVLPRKKMVLQRKTNFSLAKDGFP